MWLLRLLVGSWVAEAHWQAEFQEGDESYKGFHLEDKSYEVVTQRIRFSICSHHTVEKSFSMERINCEEDWGGVVENHYEHHGKEDDRGRQSFPKGNIQELRKLYKAKGVWR